MEMRLNFFKIRGSAMLYLKDIVTEMLGAIRELSNKPRQVIKDENSLLYLESQLTFDELKKLFAKFTKSNHEINAQNVKPFCEFLTNRWERIKNTNAIYSHNYNSNVSIVCLKLAEVLSGITKDPVYKLLMPTLHVSEDFGYELNRYVMSDDNSTMIDVLQCLEKAHIEFEKNKEVKLLHTHPINDGECLLSESEKERLLDYSYKASRYYDDMITKKLSHLEKDKNNLKKSMGKNVSSSYGESGWQLLAANLFDHIQNREQLITTLMKYPRAAWEKVLTHIEPEKLTRIVLEGRALVTVLQDKQSYNGNEAHDRIMLFLIIDNYRKGLKARSLEYTGYLRSLTGYSKEQKLDASLILYNFLRSDDKDIKLANLNDYLKKEEYKPHLGPLTASWDTLGKITKQITLVRDPNYLSGLQQQKQEVSRAGKIRAI